MYQKLERSNTPCRHLKKNTISLHLRCVQLGLSIHDLDLLTIGMVNDMYAESSNDEYKFREIATQDDFDAF